MEQLCVICEQPYGRHFKLNDPQGLGDYSQGSFTFDGYQTECQGFACEDGCLDCEDENCGVCE